MAARRFFSGRSESSLHSPFFCKKVLFFMSLKGGGCYEMMKCFVSINWNTALNWQGNQEWHAFVCFDPPSVENSISPVTTNVAERCLTPVTNMTFYSGIQELLQVIRD